MAETTAVGRRDAPPMSPAASWGVRPPLRHNTWTNRMPFLYQSTIAWNGNNGRNDKEQTPRCWILQLQGNGPDRRHHAQATDTTTISAISGPTEIRATTTAAAVADMTIDPERSISSDHHRAILATTIQGSTRIASANVDQTKGTMDS
jgi:hypothetical protein